MTKKRLFIAINLPENIKDKIGDALEKIRHQPIADDIRFLGRENWHITISFLGYQDDEAVNRIVKSSRDIAAEFEQQEIKLIGIDYGPKGKPPRMLWLNADADTSKNLAALKENLENNLIDRGVIFKKEHRQMNVHITLARFQRTLRKELPDISAGLNLAFRAASLDLMESHLSRAGAKYDILQAFKFSL